MDIVPNSGCHIPWPLTDLVTRSQRSARFHKTSTPACTEAVSTSNSFPEISDATHQFSLDQLVVQCEFHSSNSSMINLIDFIVLVRVFVAVRVSVSGLKP